MNPETAHKVTLWGLRLAEKMRVLPLLMGEVPSDPVEILGMKFPNRVGLAAGMDKEADTVNAFGQAGFGFVEVGTLTPRPQPGNDKTLCAAGLAAFALCLCWQLPYVLVLMSGLSWAAPAVWPEIFAGLGLCCVGGIGGACVAACLNGES